jgi:hypothetical protein
MQCYQFNEQLTLQSFWVLTTVLCSHSCMLSWTEDTEHSPRPCRTMCNISSSNPFRAVDETPFLNSKEASICWTYPLLILLKFSSLFINTVLRHLIFKHTYAHIYIHTYIHTLTHIQTHAWMHTYIHTHTHIHMHTHTHTHAYTHACIHIHTHIHTYILHYTNPQVSHGGDTKWNKSYKCTKVQKYKIYNTHTVL